MIAAEQNTPRTSPLDALRRWPTLRFAAIAVVKAFSPSTYRGAALEVIEKQVYFTAWEILPGFIPVVALLSIVIIQIVGVNARAFGLHDYTLELVLRILVLELLPLLTALLIAVRTGAAINTEVALMKINNELRALELVGVDPVHFELLPRVIGGTVAVLALTALSVVMTLGLAHLLIVDFQPWNLPPGEFSRVIGKVFSIPVLLVLWGKTLAFGFAVTVIPIAAGLAAPERMAYAPVSVRRGMVRLFFSLLLIEVGSLALIYVF